MNHPNRSRSSKRPITKHVMRRVRRHPVAIPSMVMEKTTGKLMFYDKENHNFLYPETVGELPTVFPTSTKARSAKWHVVMNSGIPMSHPMWVVIPADA